MSNPVNEQSLALFETTVAQVNGVPVAASGIFEDDRGRLMVDLTVNRVKVPDLAEGAQFDVNGVQYRISGLKPSSRPRRGQILIEKVG